MVVYKDEYLMPTHTPLPFQDIFRKYPSQYESIISTLCENLDSLDEPEARCVPVPIH